ncbi:hypothetical protein DBR37_06520 [Herminiimonas sp. KBW02]|uniref:hypothetical protein n=1 Tax=Herminiimonas sp. KBW02 TaxID=2153363 RepID=UPI000F590893|nr:hypothetical protein [Herminiimonas sp. KBW02]RQO35994.1 hypothetical protein DBR37_06520 [Herminiimonas sp. KBW02]
MSISILNSTQRPSTVPATSARDAAQRPAEKNDAAASDKVTLGAQPAEDGTYGDLRNVASASQSRPADVAAMLEESNRKVKEIINLILPLVEQQGLNLAKVVSGEQKLTTDAASIEEAQAAIAEDGEFGIKAVAERILNFAKSVIGGDPSKLEAIRAAVEKGFKEATEMLGGVLPEISQKTHKAIMTEFDRWQSDGIPETVDISVKADSTQAQAA